ncbi:BZ3500_MvSof-1268-A1-R1_Chr2-1g04305 [Microbotryum saponariae]|uniref:BZ3500_MvSof-1268-A1-R1_Chr2-1g04305 protein n=1 Tax=Microbotryum saponariae TaxID=289078 RepID=A0A2X0K714_9BASI|nr:BZ3500_MvSof-1268-A1-R1_Chr2-1g04305 [Microbotryum saponariae]SCZ91381.1 BZ3501_MvSof-1269-A2-R1_Chr2-1g03961 [Microbotryum saponariae]
MRTCSIVFALGTLLALSLPQIVVAAPQAANSTDSTEKMSCNSCVTTCNQKNPATGSADMQVGTSLADCMNNCISVHNCES